MISIHKSGDSIKICCLEYDELKSELFSTDDEFETKNFVMLSQLKWKYLEHDWLMRLFPISLSIKIIF